MANDYRHDCRRTNPLLAAQFLRTDSIRSQNAFTSRPLVEWWGSDILSGAHLSIQLPLESYVGGSSVAQRIKKCKRRTDLL